MDAARNGVVGFRYLPPARWIVFSICLARRGFGLINTYRYQLAAIVKALRSGEALPTEGEMVLRQQLALDVVYEAAGLAGLRWG